MISSCADQHSDTQLIKGKRIRDCRLSSRKWNAYTVPAKARGHGRRRSRKSMSHRWWMTTGRHCLLDTAEQLYMRAHRIYCAMCKTRAYLHQISECTEEKYQFRSPKTKITAQRRFIFHKGTEGRE